MRSSVDLPHPEGPMTETNSPASTVRETARSASVGPARLSNVLSTPASSMMGEPIDDLGCGRGARPGHDAPLDGGHDLVEDDPDHRGHENGGPEIGRAPVVVLGGIDDHHAHAESTAHRQLAHDGADDAGGG